MASWPPGLMALSITLEIDCVGSSLWFPALALMFPHIVFSTPNPSSISSVPLQTQTQGCHCEAMPTPEDPACCGCQSGRRQQRDTCDKECRHPVQTHSSPNTLQSSRAASREGRRPTRADISALGPETKALHSQWPGFASHSISSFACFLLPQSFSSCPGNDSKCLKHCSNRCQRRRGGKRLGQRTYERGNTNVFRDGLMFDVASICSK